MIWNTWCEHLLSYKIIYKFLGAYSTHLTYSVSRVSYVSNLNIYKSLISPLWEHYTQYLIIYRIDLVLLLLLLIFCNTLLSYLLVLIRTITAPGIPVRCNSVVSSSQIIIRNYSAKVLFSTLNIATRTI